MTDILLGTVVAVQANFYQVRLDLHGAYLLCTRRTLLKKIGQKVMVGDRVEVVEADLIASQGAIAEVLPRKNQLERPPIANSDLILLVFAIAEPELDPWQLSKFLVKAESTGLTVSLCLNKVDLISPSSQEYWQKRLRLWGYEPIFISVEQNIGLDRLQEKLHDRVTVLAGPSGVGKSSSIDRLIPGSKPRVGEVSGKLQKGRHTTRHVELFELPQGGLIADSPGFNQPDLDIPPSQLITYFPEVRHQLEENTCQFANCLHREEPNCNVRGNWERYEHYLKFLEEAIAKQEIFLKRTDEESNFKLKVKDSGRHHYEPKLATKKYRRTSRKENKQNVRDFYQEIDEWGDS